MKTEEDKARGTVFISFICLSWVEWLHSLTENHLLIVEIWPGLPGVVSALVKPTFY